MNKHVETPSFPYTWGTERRFNAYSDYFKKTFGKRIQKLSIDAGFTCPNRDGSVGRGGCSYCNNEAFNPSYCSSSKSITRQIQEGIAFHAWRYRRATEYLAYFQPYSNTYAPLNVLKERYEEALNQNKIAGLVIGTRPDCVDDEKLDYLAELSKKYYVIVEYGIESCYDRTLLSICRGHGFEQTRKAIIQTAERGIKVGGHLIFGLPGETKEMMLAEAKILSELPLDTLKFHQLQIFKHTQMEKDFFANPEKYKLFTMEEYLDFMVQFIERLSPHIVIERFAGEVPPRFQACEGWEGLRYDQILKRIEDMLEQLKTYQGRLYGS